MISGRNDFFMPVYTAFIGAQYSPKGAITFDMLKSCDINECHDTSISKLKCFDPIKHLTLTIIF